MLKKKKADRIHPMDYKFVPADPDPDFDPAHNRRVIRKSIRDTEANMRRKGREHNQAYRERAEATSRYLKNLQQGRGASKIDKYFSRKHLAYLKGKEVKARIEDELRVIGSDGSVIRRKGQA